MAEPEMRRAASGKATPIRNIIKSTDTIADEVADRQASKIARTYLIGHSVASTIARLAFEVARS